MLPSGTSNDSWTGGSIVSQLNPDILTKIQACFQVRELVRLSFDFVYAWQSLAQRVRGTNLADALRLIILFPCRTSSRR